MIGSWNLFEIYGRLWRSLVKLLPLYELSTLLTSGTIVETCINDRAVLRTIVQLDGDVMTFVVPVAVTDDAIHARHWKEVRKQLATIADQLNGVVRVSTRFIGIVVTLVLFGSIQDPYVPSGDIVLQWVGDLTFSVLPGFLVGIGGYWRPVRRMLGKLILKTSGFWLGGHLRYASIDAMLQVRRRVG